MACVDSSRRPIPSTLELLVRGGLAVVPITLVGGWIAAQYVEVHIFSWLFPALVGLAAAWLGGLAVGRDGIPGLAVSALGAVGGLLATALGFRLFPHGPSDPLHPWSQNWLPYVCSVGGAALWLALLRPPPRP